MQIQSHLGSTIAMAFDECIENDSLRAEVLQGVTQFVALYDHEYDPIRLIRQLQRTSPVAIYRSGHAMTVPNYQKYMLQILKAYNGSSRTKSLPIKQ